MRNALKFLIALGTALLLLLLFRALAFTTYTLTDNSMEPNLKKGDRVLVNRWSYGLRVGGDSLFHYSRILRQPVKKGDFIAFNVSQREGHRLSACPVLIGRVTAVPGDTVTVYGQQYIIPVNCQLCLCDPHTPYMVASPKGKQQMLVPERDIIGRVCLVLYNYQHLKFRKDRWLQLVR